MDNASKGLKALIQKEINYCESQLKKIFTAYSDSESDLESGDSESERDSESETESESEFDSERESDPN